MGSGAVYVFRMRYPLGASDQVEAVIPGTPTTFSLKVTVPSSGPVAFSTVAGPASGTVSYENETRRATYTPEASFTAGADSLTYRVTAGDASATASVRMEMLDESRTTLKLVETSSRLDGPACAANSLFRIDATWLNTGPAVPALLAKELVNTGGTLEESRLEPAEGTIESGAPITGHFAIRMRDCLRFRFRIGLFSDLAEADSLSPAAYFGGLWFESPTPIGELP